MLRAIFLYLTVATLSFAQEQIIHQPIIDYAIAFPSDTSDAAPVINPFENYTYFASDFGWMGPASHEIDAKQGNIRIRSNHEWSGAWHSLAGLATDTTRLLDPNDLIGLGGPDEKRCGINAVSFVASGHGQLKIELTNENRHIIWSSITNLDDDQKTTKVLPISPKLTRPVKFINWVAEPNCNLKISSLSFIAKRPEMTLEEWTFRTALGKLCRCHDPVSGLTRDRGHLPANKFDSIASTGMHTLAHSLAAAEGIVDLDSSKSEFLTTWTTLKNLPTACGFLPHFIYRNPAGKLTIHPKTEFSVVDSAIALHSLLLAAQVLDLPDAHQEIADFISKLNFDQSTDAKGGIIHGYMGEEKKPIPHAWTDWGGESALVLALEAMVPNRKPRGVMSQSGEVFRGCGFIAEIQSLFYPDFDRPEPDSITKKSWPSIRKKLLKRQMAYPTENWPKSAAAQTGIFGLSAGEAGGPTAGYTANGVDVMGINWLHPHYMIMGLALSGGELYPQGLQKLDAANLLYPLGLPENIEIGLKFQNPMHGSLNASFEALSAYHGWKKRGTLANKLDQASMNSPLLRKGAARFYLQSILPQNQ